MIPHSSLYTEAIRYSTTMSTIVDVYVGGSRVHANIPVIEGSVTSDRGSKVRWTASVEIALNSWEQLPLLDAYQSRIKIYRGITSLGRTEMLQLGEYRVDEISRSEIGHLTIAGSGLESYVVDARFIRPRTPPYGVSTVATIKSLISEGMPSSVADVRPMNTTDRKMLSTAPWDRDRIDAVLALGDSINADVYANYAGIFVIKDKPVIGVPVFLANVGADGVLIGEEVKNARDGVYNAVSVSGQSTDQSDIPVWAWAYDSYSGNPTYYNGPFGRKPLFYASQFMYSEAQCYAVATNMLAQATAANNTLAFESVPVCFLEAGDVVQVLLSDGTRENHLLQKVDIGLSHQGTLKADTFVNRVGDQG